MAIYITPSSIGSISMLAIAAIGFALLIDVWQFTHGDDSFLSTFSIAIHLDIRLRALVMFILGILLILFGFGVWTAQVGAAAILLVMFLANGHYWTIKEARGSPNNQQTQMKTTDDQAHRCPLTPQQKDWCTEDIDGDGIDNQYDEDYNKGNVTGQKNCARNYYVSNKACT